ncbi:hypothetical protein PENSPDRAFT_652518 [Peniophora sp. CONT]|nr:hypothetical protein PENSPDRAFT_652518 [Peniophora sp. CONT]
MFIPLSSELLSSTLAIDSSLPAESATALPAAVTSSFAAGDTMNPTSIPTTTPINSIRALARAAPTSTLSAGSIAGIALGGILFLALTITLSIFFYRHLRHRAQLNAERLRIQKEQAARQAAIDEQIRREKMREEVFKNAKIIEADARERALDRKWERLRAEGERKKREAAAAAAAAQQQQQVEKPVQALPKVEMRERTEREVYRPAPVSAANPLSHNHGGNAARA